MKKILLVALVSLMPMAFAQAEAVPGQPAPAFEVKDAAGKTRSLADAKGKWLVLEWFNKDCPYVKKHYGSGNMQALQKTYTGKDVVWFSVNSGAKGKEGNESAADTLKTSAENKSQATAVLIDESGTMGKAYGAKTTPHIFIINPQGKVVYAGAIDDNNSSDPKTIAKAKNYVSAALDAGLSGKAIETASARPYGCSVKY